MSIDMQMISADIWECPPPHILLVELNRYCCTLNNDVHFTKNVHLEHSAILHENYIHVNLGLLFNPVIH